MLRNAREVTLVEGRFIDEVSLLDHQPMALFQNGLSLLDLTIGLKNVITRQINQRRMFDALHALALYKEEYLLNATVGQAQIAHRQGYPAQVSDIFNQSDLTLGVALHFHRFDDDVSSFDQSALIIRVQAK